MQVIKKNQIWNKVRILIGISSIALALLFPSDISWFPVITGIVITLIGVFGLIKK